VLILTDDQGWPTLGCYGGDVVPTPLLDRLAAENYSRDTFTIAMGPRAAGYATGFMDKWHLTANADGNYTGLNPRASKHCGIC